MLSNEELGEIEPGNIRGRAQVSVCWQPFKSFTVTPEGYMSGCVIDYQKDLITADLNKTTLKEAWHNAVYTEWRRKHLSRNLKGLICQNCIYNTKEPVTPLMSEYAEHFSS
jgi:radical SAM protein with 4Fe4S-binding SPASM domain